MLAILMKKLRFSNSNLLQLGPQFKQPLLEFSDVCAGCSETPYAKLVTQLSAQNVIAMQ